MNKTIERARREHCALSQGFPDSEYIKELNNIETELNESEKALTFYKYCVKNKIDLAKLDQISNDYVAIPIEVWKEKLKKLAALEIIKRCPEEVIEEVEAYYSFEELYKDWGKTSFIKNKEEFDLLKEVLL